MRSETIQSPCLARKEVAQDYSRGCLRSHHVLVEECRMKNRELMAILALGDPDQEVFIQDKEQIFRLAGVNTKPVHQVGPRILLCQTPDHCEDNTGYLPEEVTVLNSYRR